MCERRVKPMKQLNTKELNQVSGGSFYRASHLINKGLKFMKDPGRFLHR
ncbi:bacteriocin [Staphylococcus auricularis]